MSKGESVQEELLELISPVKRLTYLHKYFARLQRIAKYGSIWRSNFFFAIAALKIVNYFALYLVEDTDERAQYLLLNYLTLLRMPPDFAIVLLNIFEQTLYTYKLSYFVAHGTAFTTQPKQILVDGNTALFLKSGHELVHSIRRYAFVWLNALQSQLTVSNCCSLVYLQALLLGFIFKDLRSFASLFGIFEVVQLEINLHLTTGYILEASNTGALMILLMLLSAKICFTQLRQSDELLRDCALKVHSFKSNHHTQLFVQLNRFFNYHTGCLKTILSANKAYGSILLHTVLVNSPTSAFVLMFWLHGRIPVSQISLVLPLVIGQLGTIFGIHLMALRFSARIHACAKPLLKLSRNLDEQLNLKQSLDITTNRLLHLKTRLKLQHYILNFHTNNRYGISYGRIRPATFQSFSRFAFFYAKFLIYFHLIHKNTQVE